MALFILEGAVRLVGIPATQNRLPKMEFDDTLGWRIKKSSSIFNSFAHAAHFSYYNPDGFAVQKENWELPLSREAPSVAFVGDSFTEGNYLPYEETFAHLLDQKLTTKQVINLGVRGYASDQYLLAARQRLGDYNVTDIVVMFFPYNDVPEALQDTADGYAKPLFGDSFDKPLNTPLTQLEGNDNTPAILEPVANRSALIQVVKPIFGQYVLVPLGLWPNRFSVEPVFHEEFAMRKSLRLIKQIEIEFPVERFMVFYIPVYEETLDAELFAHNTDLYRRICGELDMECFTAEDSLQKVADPSDFYIPLDGHFSKLGSSLVADQIYTILTNEDADRGTAGE